MLKNIIIAILLAFILISGFAYHNIEKQCNKQSTRIIELFKRTLNAEERQIMNILF